MIAVYGLAGLFIGWLVVMFYRVLRMMLSCKATGGCCTRGLVFRDVASAGAAVGNFYAGGDSSSEARSNRLAVLVQDQADGVEGLVHRLAVGLRSRPELLVALLDGGSADETGLILERLARRYNMEFYQLADGVPGIEHWPVHCYDLRGIVVKDLLKFDLSAIT